MGAIRGAILTSMVPPLLLALCGAGCSESTEETPDAGTVITDAGPPLVWVEEPGIPTNEDLLAVWGRAADDIWAVGWNGTVIHYDGLQWSLETTSSTVPLTSIHGLEPPAEPDPTAPPGPVFAAGWSGTILARGTDGAWVDAAPTSTATEDLFGVYVGQDNSAIAVGDRGRTMGWDGMAWDYVRLAVPGEFSGQLIDPRGVLKGVWSVNGNRYYVSGSGGAAYRSSNGYTSWQSIDTRVSEPLRGVWGTGNGNVYTVGLGSLILRFDGGQWRRITNRGAAELPDSFFFDIDGTGSNDITIVGWNGVIARYDGELWSVERTDMEIDLRSVWIDRQTGVAYAVGASGTVLRRDPPPAEEEMTAN